MKELLHILEGAVAGLLLPATLGWVMLTGVNIRRGERGPAALAAGLPVAAVLAAAPRGIVFFVIVACLAFAFWRRTPSEPDTPLPWLLRAALMAGISLFSGLVWLHRRPAPAGLDNALAGAYSILRGWTAPGWSVGSFWVLPYRFAGVPAAVLLDSVFWAALGWAVFAAGRRWVNPAAGVTAALLVWTAPGAWTLAGMGGGQGAFAYGLFGAVWLAALAVATRQVRLGVIALLLGAYLWGQAGGSVFSGFIYLRIPWMAIPFAALGFAWLVRRWAAVALLTFQVVTLWPGLAPAQDLTTGIEEARLVERAVGPDARIASDVPLARGLMTHRTGQDLAVLRRALQGWRERSIRVPEQDRTEYALDAEGYTGEVRFYLHGKEVARDRSWTTDRPEVFDNRDVTGTTGAVRVRFGRPVRFDEARRMASRPGLRRQAVLALKDQGYTHVLLREGSGLADELHRNPAYWGVQEAGQHEEVHLFALE